MTTTKRPAFQFYPGDWRRDLGVRMLSIAAKGLWVELMCLMHEGKPYGYLTDNEGAPIDDDAVAQLVGLSVKDYRKLLGEIERRKVSSRTDSKLLYSRRMVRDEDVRNKRAAGGPSSQDNPNVPRKKMREEGYPSGDPSRGAKDGVKGRQSGSFQPSPSSSSASASSNPLSPPGGGDPPPRPVADESLAEREAKFTESLNVAVSDIDHDAARAAVRRFLDEQHVLPKRWPSWVHRIAGWANGMDTSNGKQIPWHCIAVGINDLLDVNPEGKVITPMVLRIFAEKAPTPESGKGEVDAWEELKRRAERGEFAA